MPRKTGTTPEGLELDKFKFKIGADPEFNVVVQGRQIHASEIMSLLFEATSERFKKLPQANMGYKVEEAGNIGWDGASRTGEIRPSPEHSPKKLTENIRKLFEAFAERMPIADLSPLSNLSSAGGHIHLEIPRSIFRKNAEQIPKFSANLIKRLSPFYIPIMAGESLENLKIRKNSGYGKIMDMRVQAFGEDYTMEFRAPSAEWLISPKITEGILAYIATIYNEILYFPNSFRKLKELVFRSEKQANSVQDIASEKYPAFMEYMIDKIRTGIKTFEKYPVFKEQIDFILSPDKVLKEKENHGWEITRGWGLEKKQKINKRSFLNKSRRDLVVDADLLNNLIQFRHSEDLCIPEFVSELKNRVVTLGLKMKNTYFFFGLKKGIDKPIVMRGKDEFILGHEQITTFRDKETINARFERLRQRHFSYSRSGVIMVGVPYMMRLKNKVKEFLELVYGLEKGELKILGIKDLKLQDSEVNPLTKLYQSADANETEHQLVTGDSIASLTPQEEDAAELEDLNPDDSYDDRAAGTVYPSGTTCCPECNAPYGRWSHLQSFTHDLGPAEEFACNDCDTVIRRLMPS